MFSESVTQSSSCFTDVGLFAISANYAIVDRGDHFAVIVDLTFQKCKGLIASYLAWLSPDQKMYLTTAFKTKFENSDAEVF